MEMYIIETKINNELSYYIVKSDYKGLKLSLYMTIDYSKAIEFIDNNNFKK